MKNKILWLMALSAIAVLTLTGCNQPENSDENVGIANPASVYCEDQWWTLDLEEGLCMFSDGSYCEEWAYFRDECHPGEIIFNTTSTEEGSMTSEIYSEKDLADAETAIKNKVKEWEVAIESFNIIYAGDEVSTEELEYCQSLNADITECAVFISSFHIPEQDVEMAGAFEPNADIYGYSWYLGRTADGEWKVLTNGF